MGWYSPILPISTPDNLIKIKGEINLINNKITEDNKNENINLINTLVLK